MKKENKKQSWFKAGVFVCILVGVVSAMVLMANIPTEINLDESNKLSLEEFEDIDDGPVDVFTPGDLGYNEDGNPIYPDGTSWHVVAKVNPLVPLGADDPPAGSSKWLSAFMLDYAEAPATVLVTNATNGDYGSWGNVSGYVNNSATFDSGVDLASNDPAYFVCRACFNDGTQQDGAWNYSRYRVFLNCTGDETVGPLEEFDNSSSATGGDAEISYVDADMIFINFWFDDQGAGADGYHINDDGSLSPVYTIEARY